MRWLVRIYIVSIPVLAYCAIDRYPPLSGVNVSATVLAVFFVSAAILGSGHKNERITGKYALASLLPWLAAGILLVNGTLDHSGEVRHDTAAISTHYFLASRDIITVRSWRPGRPTETFLIGTNKYSGFILLGRPVSVTVKSGALGISWISGIAH